MNANEGIQAHPFENSLTLIDNAIRFSEQALVQFDVPPKDNQKLICVLLLHRSVELTIAIRASVVAGCPTAAAILLRTQLCLMAKLRCCKNDSEYVSKLAEAAATEHKKLLNDCIELCEDDDPRRPELQGRLQELGSDPLQKLTDLQVIIDAGCQELYKTTYRFLCKEVHTDLRTFEDNVEFNDNGLTRLKRTGPYVHAVSYLLTAVDWILISLRDCSELFNVDLSSDIDHLQSGLRLLLGEDKNHMGTRD